ncbi:MAG: hypothetical protein IID45_14050 [Planctomycetes bacterium]|nr:hypothetical protein [Planctomycetota bacterium]
MDVWQWIVAGLGVFLALRLLIGLMEQHRQNTLQKLAQEHQQEMKSKPKKPTAKHEDQTPVST